MIYDVLLISAVQRSDSDIRYAYPFPYRLSQKLSRFPCVVHRVPVDYPFHIQNCAFAIPQTPVHPCALFPFGNHMFVFNTYESVSDLLFLIFFFFYFFLGPYPQHMEVPRLGVESEPQLAACTTATAMPDVSHIFNLYHNSQQRQILNLLSKARDRTHNLMVPSRIHFHCTKMGTPAFLMF